MYISRLVVRNFRNFPALDIALEPGITCFAGENNSGKTNLFTAIRLVLDWTWSPQRRRLGAEDFAAGVDWKVPNQILISVELKDFAGKTNEEGMLLGYQIGDDHARLTYRFRPGRTIREDIAAGAREANNLTLEDYKWELRGGGAGVDPASVDWDCDFGTGVDIEEIQQGFLVVFMEALRDIQTRLGQSRYSPLQQLLTQTDISEDQQEELVSILRNANSQINENTAIENVGTGLTTSFLEASGRAHAMSVRLGMAEPTFADISRGLKVLLSGYGIESIDPSRNGLGLNNVLHMVMLLRFLQQRAAEAKTAGQLLLVEEPEAHLHPQLQRVLIRTLQNQDVQTFVTTHSTHISSHCSLRSIIVLTSSQPPVTQAASPCSIDAITPEFSADLERYLDATRATLLFCRAVILVEGPAEQFLIPPLVREVMKVDLDEAGVALVPIHGVHFGPYASLFGEAAIQKRCAIVADGDLKPSDAAYSDTDEELAELPPAEPDLNCLVNQWVQVYRCRSTFERAMTMAGTLAMMSATCRELGAIRVSEKIDRAMAQLRGEDDATRRGTVVEAVRDSVLNTAKRIGKARFAQVASKHVGRATSLPRYIADAVRWVTQT